MVHNPHSDPKEPIMHPLVEHCLMQLQPGPGSEKYALDRRSLQWVAEALGKVNGTDLAIAARELLIFAHQLDQHLASPSASDTVVKLVAEQGPRLAALGTQGAELMNALESTTERARIAAFMGTAANNGSLQSDTPPPAGSFRAGPLAEVAARRKKREI